MAAAAATALPKPFAIGLTPLDVAAWVVPDAQLGAYLDEKERLIAERFGDVFAEQAETREAQREVLELLADHLPSCFPDVWRRAGETMEIRTGGTPSERRVRLDSDEPPLLTAARLVQEDLVLMRRGAQGWHLAAACVCFPSSWTLREKFGRPIERIHKPVPGFGAGTRNAALIARIFDNLQPELPVVRSNWSLSASARLHNPFSESGRQVRAGTGALKFAGDPFGRAWLRGERQTLRKLAQSGDILFTIRVHLDPLATLRETPHGAAIAAELAGQLAALDDDQLAYKGILADRDGLVTQLRDIASAG